MSAAGPTQDVLLASETDFDAFRAACRRLLQQGIAPSQALWRTPQSDVAGLFESGATADALLQSSIARSSSTSPASPAENGASAAVPRAFVALCETVILHREPRRFDLMYRLLWRLTHEPALRHDAIDPDRLQAEQMASAVRRDLHKMKAFVRFRPIECESEAMTSTRDAEVAAHQIQRLPPNAAAAQATTSAATHQLHSPSSTWHVAWFEPEHRIVEAVAPFFVRRFTQMRWAILTPDASVQWDGGALHIGPGARREDAPSADAGERLWLTYYESIFNPARLKLATMRREMPARYWHNLPEAQLIAPLAAEAASRSDYMIAKAPTDPQRRRPQAATAHAHERGHQTEPNQEVPIFERPSSLADLRQAIDRCRECPIGEHATQGVPGEGPERGARLMFVGEQPGDQEDLRGRPFVGPAGQLLNRAFADLNWPRETIYVTNAVKHFKFELRGKRRIHKTPAQQEAAACLHWLESEIELLQPEALVALGATAARQLMGRPVAVMRERGQWLSRSDGRRVLVTLHPSALLRVEEADKASAYAAWLADLRHANRFFDAVGDKSPARDAKHPRG